MRPLLTKQNKTPRKFVIVVIIFFRFFFSFFLRSRQRPVDRNVWRSSDEPVGGGHRATRHEVISVGTERQIFNMTAKSNYNFR